MSFTQGDKAECKEIAREIIKEVLAEHIKACPHHLEFLVGRAKIIGLICGIIVASGISSGTVTAIVMRFLG